MDLNEQNNISVVGKMLKLVIITILITFMFGVPKNAYAEIYVSESEDNDVIVNDKIVDYKNIYVESNIEEKASTANVFNSNTSNIFNINLKGYSIKLADNTVGFLSSVNDKYSVLEEICNTYVNELNLNVKNIIQVEILGAIDYNLEKEKISTLKESGEIAKEVYNAEVINDDLLGLELKVNLTEASSIEPEVVVEESDDLYMGQSQTIQGVTGESLLYKEITYDGLNKNEERIINEQVIKPVVNTIVKVGVKNPYYDGIAFLANPSKGGYLSSTFGEVRATSVHKGIDIAKNLGENVNAALDGVVIKAGYNNGGYGNLIIVEHENNMKTYYAHLNDIYVKQGDIVKKNDVIGAIGSTGNSTGPHLHFELRVDNKPVDPIKYIEQ